MIKGVVGSIRLFRLLLRLSLGKKWGFWLGKCKLLRCLSVGELGEWGARLGIGFIGFSVLMMSTDWFGITPENYTIIQILIKMSHK